jgi:hypothetical protein
LNRHDAKSAKFNSNSAKCAETFNSQKLHSAAFSPEDAAVATGLVVCEKQSHGTFI